MIQTYQVLAGSVSTTILQTGLPEESTVYNPSTTDTISISDTSGGVFFPLPPGTTLTWDAGKPLYAQCANAVTLYVLTNGGSINNPAILANLIVGSGLAASIAANISVSGAPPISVTDFVMTRTFTQAAGADTTSAVSSDVSKYQSLIFRVAEFTSAVTANPTPRKWIVYWYKQASDAASGPGAAIAKDTFWSTDTNNALFDIADVYATFTTYIKASFFQVVSVANGVGSGANAMFNTVIGTYRNVPKEIYFHASGHNNTSVSSSIDEADGGVVFKQWAAKAAGTAINDYPSTVSGRCVFTVEVTGCTTAGQVFIADPTNGTVYKTFQFAVNAAIVSQSFELELPCKAILVSFSSAMAAGLSRYALHMAPS